MHYDREAHKSRTNGERQRDHEGYGKGGGGIDWLGGGEGGSCLSMYRKLDLPAIMKFQPLYKSYILFKASNQDGVVIVWIV